MKKAIKITVVILLVLGISGATAVLGINYYVKSSSGDAIISAEQASELDFDAECILVLGCRVLPDGTPSHMLEDRLLQSIELYNSGVSPKIIMSGDNGTNGYDEVNTMKSFAIAEGVPSEDIFMDHAGFSTYESMYRARDIFGVKRVIIVTQEYHLYRAIYIARSMGLEAYGVASNPRTYAKQPYYDLREILARNKDFFFCVFKPEPTFLGDTISVHASGDVTNDK